MPKKWILASSSPRRIELLRTIMADFDVCSASVEELHTVPDGAQPELIAQINAKRKAEWVAEKHPDAYVIGADTIVVLKKSIFNKPKNLEEARWMLEQLSGQTHHVITAACITCKANRLCKAFTVHSPVTFAPLESDFIGKYLQEIHPLDKAGAYAIQHPLTQKFATFSPEDYTNIMGFPVNTFKQIIERMDGSL